MNEGKGKLLILMYLSQTLLDHRLIEVIFSPLLIYIFLLLIGKVSVHVLNTILPILYLMIISYPRTRLLPCFCLSFLFLTVCLKHYHKNPGDAIIEEMNALEKNDTWELIELWRKGYHWLQMVFTMKLKLDAPLTNRRHAQLLRGIYRPIVQISKKGLHQLLR